MSVYGRVYDILIAFICMFVLPFMMFRAELSNTAIDKTKEEALVFLDRVEKSGALDKDFVTELLLRESNKTKIIVEIKRQEYLKGLSEPVTAKYSFEEVKELLDEYGSLPLRTGDEVEIKLCRYYFFTGTYELIASYRTKV